MDKFWYVCNKKKIAYLRYFNILLQKYRVPVLKLKRSFEFMLPKVFTFTKRYWVTSKYYIQ